MERDDEYNKMCIAAQEIQDLWKREYGDWYLIQQQGTDYLILLTRSESDKRNLKYPCYWILTQCNLQALLRGNYKTNSLMLTDFMKHFYVHDDQYGWVVIGERINITFNTMEKLWLSFVMFTLYTKVWNGEEWVSP